MHSTPGTIGLHYGGGGGGVLVNGGGPKRGNNIIQGHGYGAGGGGSGYFGLPGLILVEVGQYNHTLDGLYNCIKQKKD